MKKKKMAKINLVTHHWSNNAMKGHDVYERIDNWIKDREDFTFTYIGRSHGPLPNTELIEPLAGAELGKLLSSYDVLYLSLTMGPRS